MYVTVALSGTRDALSTEMHHTLLSLHSYTLAPSLAFTRLSICAETSFAPDVPGTKGPDCLLADTCRNCEACEILAAIGREPLPVIGRNLTVGRLECLVRSWTVLGDHLSAQHNRRTARALVCGALLVYGCLRIPAAAEPTWRPDAELQKRTESVRQLAAGPQELG